MNTILQALSEPSPWMWLAVGAVLLAVEIASTTTYLLWPGIAALLVGLLKFLVPPLNNEICVLLFAVLSVAATIAWKRSPWGRAVRHTHATLNERSAQYRGRIVTAASDFIGTDGAVLVDDTRWSARSSDGTSPQKGDKLLVTGADGTRLLVKAE